MPRRPRHHAASLVAASLVLAALTSACNDSRELRGATTTSRPFGVAAPTTDAGRVAARLAGIDTAELRLGQEFNRQFLAVQFRAVGFTAGEVTCAVDAVVGGDPDEFAQRPVGAIMTVQTVTPTVLTACVSTDRLMELANGGVRPDLSQVPPDELRSAFTTLATGGYLAAGFTAEEAACVADAALDAATDEDLAELTTSVDLSALGVADALDGCVTAERITQLAG